jgi:arylsulfatase
MNMRNPTIIILLSCALLSCFSAAYAQDKPNIVLVFLDNTGWGEPGFNGGGIIRGATTPRSGSGRCLVHRPT